jgi:hypothetical protein
MSCYDG